MVTGRMSKQITPKQKACYMTKTTKHKLRALLSKSWQLKENARRMSEDMHT